MLIVAFKRRIRRGKLKTKLSKIATTDPLMAVSCQKEVANFKNIKLTSFSTFNSLFSLLKNYLNTCAKKICNYIQSEDQIYGLAFVNSIVNNDFRGYLMTLFWKSFYLPQEIGLLCKSTTYSQYARWKVLINRVCNNGEVQMVLVRTEFESWEFIKKEQCFL